MNPAGTPRSGADEADPPRTDRSTRIVLIVLVLVGLGLLALLLTAVIP